MHSEARVLNVGLRPPDDEDDEALSSELSGRSCETAERALFVASPTVSAMSSEPAPILAKRPTHSGGGPTPRRLQSASQKVTQLRRTR